MQSGSHSCPHCGGAVDELNLTFNFEDRTVTVNNRVCKLRPSQLDILECLIDKFPEAITLAEIYAEVYSSRDDEKVPNQNMVVQNIHDMRQRFRKSGVNLQLLYVTGQNNNRVNNEGAFLLTHCEPLAA